jgi:hypothetical protein
LGFYHGTNVSLGSLKANEYNGRAPYNKVQISVFPPRNLEVFRTKKLENFFFYFPKFPYQQIERKPHGSQVSRVSQQISQTN